MPTCLDCDTWWPPGDGATSCASCGGALLSRDALLERRAAAVGMPVDAYRAKRAADREAERRARDEAAAAQYAAQIEAAAAKAGLTVDDYKARWRRAEAAGWMLLLAVGVSVPVALLLGVVLLVAFIATGHPPVAAIGGTIAGLLVGVVGSALIMRGDSTIRFVIAVPLPPAMTVVASIALVALLG